MKVKSSAKFILLFLSFQTIACFSNAQISLFQQTWIPNFPMRIQAQSIAKLVMHDNELEKNKLGADENIFANPLRLNGKILDYNTFTISSKGKLSVVKGNPSDANAEKILFSIKVRREGKIIRIRDFSGKGFEEYEVSKILAFAIKGDQLIIDPINKKDWKAKRILNIIMIEGC